jgi:hypothetical protein
MKNFSKVNCYALVPVALCKILNRQFLPFIFVVNTKYFNEKNSCPVLLVTTFITILTRCKKAVNNTGIEPWLIFKFKSDSAQTRLNNIGQTKGVAYGRWEPGKGEQVVEMGIRGMIPKIQ